MSLVETMPMTMMIGSKGYCDLIITITKNGMKILDVSGVKKLLPRTTDKETLKENTTLKYKITNDQASFIAMWHLSEIYGVTVNINAEGTNMTSKRVAMTDDCIEELCKVFIIYEKQNLTVERRKCWNRQLVMGNLLLLKFDKWNCWRTVTAMAMMKYYPPIQLELLGNVTQIDSAIDFSEAERIFNIINDEKIGKVQGDWRVRSELF